MAEFKEFFFARKRWYDADEVGAVPKRQGKGKRGKAEHEQRNFRRTRGPETTQNPGTIRDGLKEL